MFQDIDPDILEAATLVENEYQEFFKSKLKEYGVESPADLDYEQSKAFFDEIRNEWGNGSVNESEEEEVNEEDEGDELNEGVEDVYSTIYNNLVKPNDLTVGNIVSFPYSGYDTDFKIELIVNPSCFGMPTIYHLKALNGPCEGDECVFEEEDLHNKLDNINESEEVEIIDRDNEEDEIEVNEEDELMNKIVEALENNSMFESEDEEDEKESEVNEEDEELNESEELEESTDFDITKEDDKKLEEILKVFLKSKAMDGDDYEIVSKGSKLILKVYNKKFIKDIEKLLK